MFSWKKKDPGVVAKKAQSGPPAVTGNSKPKTAAKPGPKPPEEAFWQRYSPNHEFPLSGATSIAIHVLVGAFLLVAGTLLLGLIGGGNKLDLDTIMIAGGGGKPGGEGTAPGDQPPASAPEDVENPAEDVKKLGNPLAEAEPLKLPTIDPLNLSRDNEVDARYINKSSEAVKGLAKLSEKSRKAVFNLKGPGEGKGGPGLGGGKDTGRDKGEGAHTGAGKSTFNQRQKRVLRWVMKFSTTNGNDYRRQLSALHAYLAFPQPDGTYRVYKDLNQRPAKGEIQDLSTINRIFWIDEKPESIRSLADAMGLEPPDEPIIAFFPVELEAKLLKMELAYRGKKEEDIKETHFEIRRSSGGTYEPRVAFQE